MKRRIEVVKITDEKTRSVSETPVCLDQPIEYFVRNAHVFTVIFCGNPQTYNFGAELFDNFLRCNDIAQGLGHFATLAIQREAMGKNSIVRRTPTGSYRRQQRRVEPAAVLVTSLQIKISASSETWISLH